MPETTRDVKPCPKCGTPIRTRYKMCARCGRKGHTPEQRDQHALCGAKRTNGEPCRQFAGAGTEHRGFGKCRFHAGRTPSGRKNAVMIETRQQLAALGDPLPEDVRPAQQLLWLSRTIGGHVNKLLADPDLADPSTERGRAVFRLTMEQVDRAARLAKACSEANVEQTTANLQQAQATVMVRAIREAAREAGLTNLQVRALGVALKAQLATNDGDNHTAADSQKRLARLRDQIEAVERRRIEREAARFAGLELPPDELIPNPTPVA
jgi:hypothetical protein